jgi:hypothetical protein
VRDHIERAKQSSPLGHDYRGSGGHAYTRFSVLKVCQVSMTKSRELILDPRLTANIINMARRNRRIGKNDARTGIHPSRSDLHSKLRRSHMRDRETTIGISRLPRSLVAGLL